MISKKTALLGEVMPCLFLCSLVKQYGYRLHGKKNVHVNSKFCKSVLSVPNSPFLIFIFSCLHFLSGLTQLQLKGKLFFMEATSELLKIHFWCNIYFVGDISTESKRVESQNQQGWKAAIFIPLWWGHLWWIYKTDPRSLFPSSSTKQWTKEQQAMTRVILWSWILPCRGLVYLLPHF